LLVSIWDLARKGERSALVDEIEDNPNLQNYKDKNTVLHVAVLAMKNQIVREMLTHPKIDIMVKNAQGQTVIDLATDLLKKTQKRSMKHIVDLIKKYCRKAKIESTALKTRIELTTPGIESVEDLKLALGQKLY